MQSDRLYLEPDHVLHRRGFGFVRDIGFIRPLAVAGDLSLEVWEMQLGEFIVGRREKLGLTQKDVADRLGLTTGQFISNWERGVSYPPNTMLKKLASVLQTQPMTLVELKTAVYMERICRQAKIKI